MLYCLVSSLAVFWSSLLLVYNLFLLPAGFTGALISSLSMTVSVSSSEVGELKMNKSNCTLTNNDASVPNNDLVNLLSNENQDLKNEIKILREKNINITHTVADLNSKIEELESEKQSLKTALKIIYADLESAEGNMHSTTDKHKAQQHPWTTVPGKTKGHPINLESNNNNKYSALYVEDKITDFQVCYFNKLFHFDYEFILWIVPLLNVCLSGYCA